MLEEFWVKYNEEKYSEMFISVKNFKFLYLIIIIIKIISKNYGLFFNLYIVCKEEDNYGFGVLDNRGIDFLKDFLWFFL